MSGAYDVRQIRLIHEVHSVLTRVPRRISKAGKGIQGRGECLDRVCKVYTHEQGNPGSVESGGGALL